MGERKASTGRTSPACTPQRRPIGAAGEGSQGGVSQTVAVSRSAAVLQIARERRPELAQLIHLATGAREQLELFGWPGRGSAAGVPPAQAAAADRALSQPVALEAPAHRCPACGAALGSGDEAHSMTGDVLADHLLDYHEGELGSSDVTYRRRKEQARALAQELRRGAVRKGVKPCT